MLEIAKLAAATGASVHWLRPNSKAPLDEGWSTAAARTPAQLAATYKAGFNLGLRPGTHSEVGPGVYLYVFDVDIKSGDPAAALREVKSYLGETWQGFPRVKSGAGYHFYFTSARALSSKLLARGDGWELELYGTGKNLVLPPSTHPVTGRCYEWETPPPWEALALGLEFPLPDEARLAVAHTAPTVAGNFENDKPPCDLKGLSAQDYLDRVPNDNVHYDDWLTVGAALHHQFDGSDEGFALWEGWSQRSVKHTDAEYLHQKWTSFSVNRQAGDVVTFRSVIDRAGGVISELDAYRKKLADMNTVGRCTKLAAEANLSHVERELLCKDVMDRVKALTGSKPTLDAVRKDVANVRKDAFEHTVKQVDGFREWAFAVREKAFYHMNTGVLYDKEQFSDVWAADLYGDADSEEDYQLSAARLFIRNPDTRKVHGITYVPGGEPFVTNENNQCVNTWRDTLVAPTAGDAKPFFAHLDRLIPSARDRKIFIDYLAALLLRPGLKVRWAPILVGKREGGGKSAVGEFVRYALNHQNVEAPENEQLHEKFTDWAFGNQVVIIEELMAHGRAELANKLKTHITGPTIRVRPFGARAFEAPNCFNFLMFTNHDNAMIVNQGARRYFVVDTDSALADAGTEYFTALYDCISRRPGAIVAELAKRDLTEFETLASGRAPQTAALARMIDATVSPTAQHLQSAVDTGHDLFMGGVVLQREIFQYLEGKLGTRAPSYRNTPRYLEELGYTRIVFDDGTDRMKIDGRQEVCWALADTRARMQRPFDKEDLRRIFAEFTGEGRAREVQRAVAGIKSV